MTGKPDWSSISTLDLDSLSLALAFEREGMPARPDDIYRWAARAALAIIAAHPDRPNDDET